MIDKVLVDAETLQARVKELGQILSAEYEDGDLILICVLKGGVAFLTDLMRHIAVPHEIDFLAISSYGAGQRESTGAVRLIMDLKADIAGRDVLIVEDIVDSGRTMEYLLRMLGARNPASLRICTLLSKPSRREVNIPVICRSAGNDILRPWIVYPFRYGSRWLASPIVEDVLFPFFKRMNSPEIVNLFLRRRRYELANQGARSMDLIIANSHFTASLLQQQAGVSGNRVRTVVGGVDAGRFAVDHRLAGHRRPTLQDPRGQRRPHRVGALTERRGALRTERPPGRLEVQAGRLY